MGPQVISANWGIVDDHAIFSFLGTNQRLPISDFFHTLLTKTEVGNPDLGRFRPSFYVLTLVETVAWGKNVHLWYLARMLFFAAFIASLWWLLSQFLRLWLAGALMLPIVFLSFWSGVWSRLGPSEIYGALALALLMLGIYAMVQSEHGTRRKFGAALATLAALVLVGSKETFIPLSGAAIAALAYAAFTRRIPAWMAAVFSLVICLYAGTIFFVIQKMVLGSGRDFYDNAIDLRQLLWIATRKLGDVVFKNGLAFAYAAAILMFGYHARRTNRNLADWKCSSLWAAVIFVFMAVVYFSQQVAYRGQLPMQMRYDFPASLFVPFSVDVLICYVFYQLRPYLHPRAASSISICLALAICAAYTPGFVAFEMRPLPRAASINIEKTNAFFREISAIAASAREKPGAPIILEAHNPDAYEALTSVWSYVRAMGAENPVSVRAYAVENSKGVALFDRLEREMRSWQSEGNERFVPLSKSLINQGNGCINVGINGAPSGGCAGFEVKNLTGT